MAYFSNMHRAITLILYLALIVSGLYLNLWIYQTQSGARFSVLMVGCFLVLFGGYMLWINTPEGARDDLLKFVLSDAVPALHRGRTAIKKARAEVDERRSKLKVEGPDPSDVAAAFRRMEIRTRLREMKPDELTNYFARYDDNLPTEVAQAVTELPAEYSGVPQSRHDLLTEHAVNAQFGPVIEEIKEIEQAIEAAESSVEAARDEIRLEVGINDPAKFNELAAPIEAKHSAPWLRRGMQDGVEVIRVVDLEKGIERLATPEEIERGIEYRDYEHFMKGKAA